MCDRAEPCCYKTSTFRARLRPFLRATLLAGYIRHYPHVLLHVPTNPRYKEYIAQALALMGVPLNRTVWGNVRARIAHFPEGQGCGGPLQSTRLMVREALRAAVNASRALDVWGDGCGTTGLRQCFSALPRYTSRILQCVLDTYASTTGTQHPMSTAYRAAILDAHMEPTAGVLPVLVLVKRQGKTRHILNYDALKHALTALPVELHEYLEGTSISETFVLYSKADVIVAPHGAAQVNNMLSLPGTHLVEFDTFFDSNMMFHISSCALGHNFSFFMPRNSTYNDVGFHVDVSRVAAHVLSIVDPSRSSLHQQ